MFKPSLFFLLFVFVLLSFTGGNVVAIRFRMRFGEEALVLGKNYFSATNKDSVSIETFRFYVSNVCFLKKERMVFCSPKSARLIDFENNSEVLLQFESKKNIDFDAVVFDVGIDSITNVSGAQGGDLDATKGMYWTWQSGYINFKMEGKSNVCTTRNHAFQFHIGGYAHPYKSLKTVRLNASSLSEIKINIDVESFLNSIDLKTTNEIMSPSEKACNIAEKYKSIFSIEK